METVPLTRENAIARFVEAEADIRALGVARLALFGSASARSLYRVPLLLALSALLCAGVVGQPDTSRAEWRAGETSVPVLDLRSLGDLRLIEEASGSERIAAESNYISRYRIPLDQPEVWLREDPLVPGVPLEIRYFPAIDDGSVRMLEYEWGGQEGSRHWVRQDPEHQEVFEARYEALRARLTTAFGEPIESSARSSRRMGDVTTSYRSDEWTHGVAQAELSMSFSDPVPEGGNRGSGIVRYGEVHRIRLTITHGLTDDVETVPALDTPAVQRDLSQNPVAVAFAEYRSAILEGDAELAFQFIDSRTVEYYADILEYARTMKEEQVRALRIADMYVVLLIRSRMAPEVVRLMDAESLFKHGISAGWIDQQSAARMEIVSVDIDGTSATAEFVVAGSEGSVEMRFSEEGGKWRIDLTSVLDGGNHELAKIAAEEGLSNAEFVLLTLAMSAGEEIDEDAIWQPLDQR